MVFPTLGRFIDAASGAAFLGFALVAWRVRPRRAASVFFTMFAAGFGALLVTGNILLAEPWGSRLWWASAVFLPPALVGLIGFALTFPKPMTRAEWPLAWLASALTAAAALPYFVAAAITSRWFEPALWGILMEYMQFGFNFVLVLLPLRYARATTTRERERYATLAFGFLLWPAFFAVHRAIYVLWVPWPHAYVAFGPPQLVLFVVIALLWLRAVAIGPVADAARARNLVLLSLAVPLVLLWLASYEQKTAGVYGANGAARFATLAVLAYAFLKDGVFDIDLRLKRSLRRVTVVVFFAAAFAIAAGVTEMTSPSPAGRGVYVGLGAVFLLLFVYAPVDAVAARLVDRAMPAVREDASYQDLRRVEVYRVALENAAAAGKLGDERENAALLALRTQLGLTEREHVILLHSLATGGTEAWRDLAPGTVVLGRLRIERPLGEGSQGKTYVARDMQRGAMVVVKVARPGPGRHEALLREVRALRDLRDPHVVRVHDIVEGDGMLFLVLEFVTGGSLKDKLGTGPLPDAEFGRFARGLLRGLEAVHAAGIVHRDVKPSNVLLTKEGEAKLADFGIAHLPHADTTVGAPDGSAMGTLRYMSPEQAKGWRVTQRGDLFSAGATLFEAATGRPYFVPEARESAIELQMRVAGLGAFDAPCPEHLRSWFARALAPRPDDRFASAGEMRMALETALVGSPTPR